MSSRRNLPWYTISLLITILGALSILIFFGVHLFLDEGLAFWLLIFSWAVILIAATIEICRLEVLQKKLLKDAKDEIIKLKKEIEQLKK